ncbi:MAG: hypothetical protein WCD20_20980 [Rhodomicrobium sp.]
MNIEAAMSSGRTSVKNDEPGITPEMLRAGYAVIGEFDPDITCLTSEEAVNAMLKAVYTAMSEASLGAEIDLAIEAGLALRLCSPD